MNIRRMHSDIYRDVDLRGAWSDKAAPSVLLKYGDSFKLTGDKCNITAESSIASHYMGSTPFDIPMGRGTSGTAILNINHSSDMTVLRSIINLGETIDLILISDYYKNKALIIQECTITSIGIDVEDGTTLCTIDFISNKQPKNIDIQF